MNAWKKKAQGPSFQDLVRDDLKTKNYRPVYLLVGEDRFRIESIVNHLKADVLGAAGVAFNFHLFQGDEVPLERVLQQANSYPMLGERQIVWLRLADKCIANQVAGESIRCYCENPIEQTILIMSADKIDKRKKWLKVCQTAGYFFEFSPPAGNELVSWVSKAAERANLPLDRELIRILIDLIGSDLHALAAEIDKLALLADEYGRPLTGQDLTEVIMDQAKLEPFDINNNLGPGQASQVLKAWYRLQGWGRTAHEIAPLVLWRIRALAQFSAFRSEGFSNNEIPRKTGMNPWVCRQIGPIADAMGPDGVSRAVKAGKHCDASLKSSPLKPDLILEKTLIEICESTRIER